MANIQPDLFVKPNESLNHVQYVQNFFLDLYKRGLLIEKEVEAYYCEPCEKFLYEAHIKGICPHCHNDSDGNACEKCGQPNQCIDLGDAHCKSCSHTPSKRKIKQLFFPLSQYAEQLAAYYQELHTGAHLRALFQTMLNEGLPDIPVTHVSDWGIQVPVEGYENQTIYVWFEMAPGYLSATHDLIEEINSPFNLIKSGKIRRLKSLISLDLIMDISILSYSLLFIWHMMRRCNYLKQ